MNRVLLATATAWFLTGCEIFFPIDDYAGPNAATAEGGAGPTCSGAALCDDFDHGPLGERWNGQASTPIGGATLTLDGDASVSAPFSMRATLPPGVGSGASELAYALPGTFQ